MGLQTWNTDCKYFLVHKIQKIPNFMGFAVQISEKMTFEINISINGKWPIS